MLAYRQGDAGAFETLYARHRARLYRFVLRSVKERALAEEKGRGAAQREAAVFVTGRLGGLRFFFTAVVSFFHTTTQ